MSFSLGLALYRLTGGREQRRAEPLQARPGGRLVWLHAPSDLSRPMLVELARQLIEDDDLQVLLTGPDPANEVSEAATAPPPIERLEEVRAFLDHWRPEVVVMAEGELRPLALEELARRRIPRLLVQGIAPRLVTGRKGWFPGLYAHALAEFAAILVRDEAAARAFRKAGVLVDRLRVTGPMEEASAALPCLESDRVALAGALATRPVWLAMALPEAEEALVIAAHREALKLAHRLVLILAPEDAARAEALAKKLEDEEGWRVACRHLDQEPDAETEVYLVDGLADCGLWYRLAPVVYLGGGLSDGGCRRDPMEAAALGSAMILGPREGAWGRAYGRLARGMAARMVASASDLTLALGDLLSPDRAARQAQAAWSIASEGSEVTAEVMAMIRALMAGTALPENGAAALPAPAVAASGPG
jgi:3-deoxy-D-manno-octulosonic-acid transferase